MNTPPPSKLIRRPLIGAKRRGAVFVEAVIVITFMVLMWQLMWLVLNHYQAKQHASQQARQAVWEWGMRKQCAESEAPSSKNEDANRHPPSDYDQTATEDLSSGPCAGESQCDSPKTPSKAEMGDLGMGVDDIKQFNEMSNTRSNLAIVKVEGSYYSFLERGDARVPAELAIECNPAVQKGAPFAAILGETGRDLFKGIKGSLF